MLFSNEILQMIEEHISPDYRIINAYGNVLYRANNADCLAKVLRMGDELQVSFMFFRRPHWFTIAEGFVP